MKNKFSYSSLSKYNNSSFYPKSINYCRKLQLILPMWQTLNFFSTFYWEKNVYLISSFLYHFCPKLSVKVFSKANICSLCISALLFFLIYFLQAYLPSDWIHRDMYNLRPRQTGVLILIQTYSKNMKQVISNPKKYKENII